MKAQGVQEAFDRLRADGLDRHDAIHAIGWVLSSVLEATIRDTKSFQGTAPNDAYIKALKDLSADRWRRATHADAPAKNAGAVVGRAPTGVARRLSGIHGR
jgi:hypothetical protein